MDSLGKSDPLPSVTLQELDEAIARQCEHLQDGFLRSLEKTQAKMLDQLKVILQMELRQLIKVAESSTIKQLPHAKNAAFGHQQSGRSRASSKFSHVSTWNLFKTSTAKLNDVDDLDTEERRSSIANNLVGYSPMPCVIDLDTVCAGECPIPSDMPLLPSESQPEEIVEDIVEIDWVGILRNPALEGTVLFFVLLNSLWIGVELEYRLSVSSVRPTIFNLIEIFFCLIFSAELVLRISVLGSGFFHFHETTWTWNYFDFFLVLSQMMEILFRYVHVHRKVNVSWLRILRVLRIIRLTRIVRAVRFIEGLRTLMRCVARGMTATVWISCFLLMQIYTCSLAFTEVLHEMRTADIELVKGDELDRLFGSLSNTMGTLVQSITGGIDWNVASSPLMEVSTSLGLAFGFFVSFTIFVILNIFTGFFVNTSSVCAAEDNKAIMRDRVADIFVQDKDNQYISAVDARLFMRCINSPEMQSYLRSIDLHKDEAEGLFKLLDLDERGILDPIECVSALMRMEGSAKAFDLRVLMFMFARFQEWNTEHVMALEERIDNLRSTIEFHNGG